MKRLLVLSIGGALAAGGLIAVKRGTASRGDLHRGDHPV